jgi:hypothetical protein
VAVSFVAAPSAATTIRAWDRRGFCTGSRVAIRVVGPLLISARVVGPPAALVVIEAAEIGAARLTAGLSAGVPIVAAAAGTAPCAARCAAGSAGASTPAT